MTRVTTAFQALGSSEMTRIRSLDRQIVEGKIKVYQLSYTDIKGLCLLHSMECNKKAVGKANLAKYYKFLADRRATTVATPADSGWVKKFYPIEYHVAWKESEGSLTYLLPTNLVVFIPDPRIYEGVAIARWNPSKGTFIPLLTGDYWKNFSFLLKPWLQDELYSTIKRTQKERKEEQKLQTRAKYIALLNQI